jgi:hypothetical protein
LKDAQEVVRLRARRKDREGGSCSQLRKDTLPRFQARKELGSFQSSDS